MEAVRSQPLVRVDAVRLVRAEVDVEDGDVAIEGAVAERAEARRGSSRRRSRARRPRRRCTRARLAGPDRRRGGARPRPRAALLSGRPHASSKAQHEGAEARSRWRSAPAPSSRRRFARPRDGDEDVLALPSARGRIPWSGRQARSDRRGPEASAACEGARPAGPPAWGPQRRACAARSRRAAARSRALTLRPLRSPAPLRSSSLMRPRFLSSLALLSALGLAAPARAQGGPAVPAPADKLHTLEVEIDRDVATLASGSCAVACQALASMRHAAERVCALDPGPRCEGARAKVKDAARRVQEACGECRPLGGEAPPPVVSAEKPEVIEQGEEPRPAPPAPGPASAGLAARAAHGGCLGGRGRARAARWVRGLRRRRRRGRGGRWVARGGFCDRSGRAQEAPAGLSFTPP